MSPFEKPLLFTLLAALALASCSQESSQQASSDEAALSRAARDPALQWSPCPPIFPAGCEMTVLHGDPSKPNSDVFLRVPPSYEIPAHSHTSAERMILATGELSVTYKGAHPFTMTVGSYAYGPAKAPHKATCVGTEACTLFIAFESPVDALPHEGTLD
jgi:quercetin dioxygenase-like cupin family protein